MVTQSSSISNKIWSIASDWAALLANQKSSKQIMLSIGIHRLSASKEIVTLLNKAGQGIPYNDIRLQKELQKQLWVVRIVSIVVCQKEQLHILVLITMAFAVKRALDMGRHITITP